MVNPDAMTPSLTPPNTRIPWTEKGQENKQVLSNPAFSTMQQYRSAINGLTPIVACTCTNVGNVYTLTPFPVSPGVPNYYSYWGFSFVASATSTGAVTATIVPTTGILPTLPVFVMAGGQANAGNLVAGLFYILYYVDTYPVGVDTGGFALR